MSLGTRSRLNRFAILAAFSMLVPVITGAAVTSSHNQSRQVGLLVVHSAVAIADAVLILGLAIARARFGWMLLLAMLVETILGYLPNAGMFHATLAAILFAACAAIALVTSRSWQRDPDLVQDYGWPSLKSLSTAAAFLVAVQVGFGAGIRHSMVGVLPHLLGALVVALFLTTVGVFVMNQFPKHATLRPLAIALLSITGVQVFLGMTAFLMRMMNVAGTKAWLVVSVAHVATGSLTFGASVLLAIEIRRCVRPREAKS